MGKSLKKKSRKVEQSDSGSDFENNVENQILPNSVNSYNDDDKDDYSGDYDDHRHHDEGNDVESENEDDLDEDESEEGSENEDEDEQKGAEMEELEKEYKELQNEELDLLRNLKRHKDEDLQKGQAVKNQRALWDKTLEFRFLLQKAFSSSNRLPQEPVRSLFCGSDNVVSEAYSDLLASSKKTLDCILELQQALVENNPSISEPVDANAVKDTKQSGTSVDLNGDVDEEWLQISQMHSRMASFRNKSIDKWQRKTEVTTGAAAIKGKLHAFNQNISEQVAAYMRDPSNMIKGMQQNRLVVAVFGNVPVSTGETKQEETNASGDPELLDDSVFYQHLLKEFFDTIDPASSETAFYAMKRLQTKKRKIVDRRASKSRKIRYHVHEKIVNFMAPRPMQIPPEAPKIFQNLFQLITQKSASAV
ncbi:rRNA processing protein-related [Abeliophyllum distichum]|uniref:rRNA processing protein-related n=1 Tax=Abeliophyllum distichum TaxID=126358 RepID=A0ABD1TG20_9LAMI